MNIINPCLLAIAVCGLPTTVIAQISADGSTSTTVDTNGNVSTIGAGEQAGGNLFHSFSDFSVPNGNEAFFNNAENIDNIFSRVTGGNVSNIDGLIRANGSANLFLVNPAGIIFNDGARLDIGGSFFGSTSDSILFPNGVEFSASNPVAPILTINAPVGLNFRDEPGNIAVNGSSLTVSPGQSLNLVGGGISLDGSNLNAPQGRISLGSVATVGTVNFTESGWDFGNLPLADMTLSNGATVNVNQGGSGSITFDANNLTLSDNSILNGGIDSAASTVETQAGDVTLNLTGNLALRSNSLIRNNLSPVSSGSAGNIIVTAANLSLDNVSRIVTISQGKGNTGNIDLNVPGNIQLSRQAEIKSQVPSTVGNGGDINLVTGSLDLTAGSLIFSNVSGEGNAGDINLTARDRITLDNSNFQAKVELGGVGNSGNITIDTGSLELKNSSQENISSSILTSTAGRGNAGNISIAATNDISLEDASTIQSQVQAKGIGTGGNIKITTDNLSLTGVSPDTNSLSSLLSNSTGNGDAGNIDITASSSVSLNRFGLILSQGTKATGDAGDITINTPQLLLDTGSFIIGNTGDARSPTVPNVGDAGDITINSQAITIDNFSSIVASTTGNATIGKAGNVNLNTENLAIAGGSTINTLTSNSSRGGTIDISSRSIDLVTGGKIITLTESTGDAGDINLILDERISIDGQNAPIPTEEFRFAEEAIQAIEPNTGLFANTTSESTGNGGNVQIANPEIVSIANTGEIFVGSQGRGAGGNLSIQADSLSLDNNGLLIAETEFGQPQQQPSNINLDIEDLVTLDRDSRISARAFNNANGGNVTINTDFVIAFPAQSEGNDIVANASEGSGGNINIVAEAILGLEEGKSTPGNMTNDLDVSSEFGFSGNLSLNTPDIDATEGIRDLPVGAIAADDSVRQACSADVNSNSLSLVGRGNIPPKPTDILSSNYIATAEPSQVSKNQNHNSHDKNIALEPIVTAMGRIYPARGLKVTDTGEIVLTRSSDRPVPMPSDRVSGCLVDRQ